MVPKALHVTKFSLDLVDVFVATINQLRMIKLSGGEAKVLGLLFIDIHLVEHILKLTESILTTTIIFVEITLSEILNVGLKFILKLSNLNVVLLGLAGNNRSDLLLDVLSKLFENSPVIDKLFGLLDLGFFGKVLGGQEVQSFLKLVKLKEHRVTLIMDRLDRVNNGKELLNLSEIFILGAGGLTGLFHPCLRLLNHFGHILG